MSKTGNKITHIALVPIAQADSPETTVLAADDIESKPAPSDKELKGVRDLAADLYKRRLEIDKLAEEIKKHEEAVALLEEKTIPDAMREIGMASFALSNGFSIEIEKYAHGSVNKADEPKLFAWLEEIGSGAIIKHWITINFGMGEEKWAAKFLRDLAARKKPLKFERKDAVHASTWKSWFAERFAEEKAGRIPPEKKIPREFVHVHEGVRAVLVDHTALEAAKAAANSKRKATAARKKGEAEEVEMLMAKHSKYIINRVIDQRLLHVAGGRPVVRTYDAILVEQSKYGCAKLRALRAERGVGRAFREFSV